jgi:hypothetical protein
MATLNSLGQIKVPSVFAKVQAKGLCDLMDIVGETKAQGTGGGQVKSAANAVYQNVPVTYEPSRQSSQRVQTGEKSVSVQEYYLTFPVYHNGSRINIDPKLHRLKVLARGNEPVKIFRIEAIRDNSGVNYEAVCTKEN